MWNAMNSEALSVPTSKDMFWVGWDNYAPDRECPGNVPPSYERGWVQRRESGKADIR